MTDKDEQEALAWLRKRIDLYAEGRDDTRTIVPIGNLRDLLGVIDRLLARPVLPEEPTPAMLDAINKPFSKNTWCDASCPLTIDIYRALYAELTRPKVKTFWHGSWEKNGRSHGAGLHETADAAWTAAMLNSGGSEGQAKITIEPRVVEFERRAAA